MSVGLSTIISLSAGVALAIMCAALVFLMLWQDARRRSNQYFALCAAIFGAYGILNLPLHVAQHFDVNAKDIVHVLTVLYALGVILLFNFVLSFARLPRHLRWNERAISVPVVLLFVFLAANRAVFKDFEPVGSSTYHYRMTGWGYFGAAFLVVYLGLMLTVIYRQRYPKARATMPPMIILAAGMALFAATPNLREYALNTLSVIVAVFMMGRVVIKYQVFQPLADLNAEIDQKIVELIDATQAKAQFLANMSHELRTPLNSIIGYTELVTSGTYGELNERQRDRVYKVTRNGRILLELINDVLDLSKLHAGRVELTLTTVNTVDLLDKLLAEYEPEAREKGLSLVRAYSNLPPLRVDAFRARQILAHLLSNAVKFTGEGVVIVRGYADPIREQVVLSVTDTGPGISPDRQEHVFDAFQTSDSTLAREHPGTGLGLAIARELTTLHSGNLWFQSVVGQGSTFHVALPAADTGAPIADPVIVPRRRGSGPLVLAIDDDKEALELAQDQLEAARYRVYGTSDVNTGLQMAHELHPAVIMLDVKMPGMDGWLVLETLRSDPATANIPVLIVSAADEGETAREVGADGFIAKPVQAGALLEQVRTLAPRDTSPPLLITLSEGASS